MKTWAILKQAIPDGEAIDRVARRLNVHPDTVRRWRREPLSDDAPTESGRRSPLDRIEDLIDAVFLVNPAGAHYVADHARSFYESITARHIFSVPIKNTAADALQDVVQAVNSINLDAPLEEIELRLLKADEKMQELKRQARVNCARPSRRDVRDDGHQSSGK